MKLAHLDIPEISTSTITLNGEEIVISNAFKEVVYECQADKIIVKLYSYDNDGEMHTLATFDIEESDNIDALELLGRGYGIDIYDGYDVDAAIEWILEQCKV